MKTIQNLSAGSMSMSCAPGDLPIPDMPHTERQIDNDARSRMDDEGGSHESTVDSSTAVERPDGC